MTREESIKFWEKLARGKGVWGGGGKFVTKYKLKT